MPHLEIVLGIVGLYFAIVLGVIVFDRYKNEGRILPTLSELMLANKSLPAYVLVATYIASLFSTFSVIGIPTFVYVHGVGGYGFVITSYFLGILACFTYYKIIRRFAVEHEIYSPLEALSIQYGSKWLALICAVLFMIFITPYIAMQLVAVGAFLEALSGGTIGYLNGVGAMMAIVGIYLIIGGMRAVAYTDLIQLICMALGIVGGAWVLFNSAEFDLSGVFERKELLSLPGPQGKYDFWALLSLSIVICGAYFQPHIVTRAMMAKNDRESEMKGIGGFLAEMSLVIPVIFFGFGAIALFGSDLPPNEAIGKVFEFIAASGMFGLIVSALMLVAVLGAAMSTADSLLLSMGQIMTRDVIRPFAEFTQKRQVGISKAIMFIMLVISFVIGINPPDVMGELVVYSGAGSTIMVPIMLGFMWKYRDVRAAFASLFAGYGVLLAGTVGGITIGNIHPGFPAFLTASLTFIIVSLILNHKKLAKA